MWTGAPDRRAAPPDEYVSAVERRAFIGRGTVGLAGAVLAGGAAVGGERYEHTKDRQAQEPAVYGGDGRGAAQLVWSIPTGAKAVALTFDDGPHPELTPRILTILREHHVKATFFLIGTEVERHPDLVRRLIDEGHEIGNHTWSHPAMAHLSGPAARAEVMRGSEVIERVSGVHPSWFRSPRGMLTGPILRAAADLDQDVAMWSAVTSLGALTEPAADIAGPSPRGCGRGRSTACTTARADGSAMPSSCPDADRRSPPTRCSCAPASTTASGSSPSPSWPPPPRSGHSPDGCGGLMDLVA